MLLVITHTCPSQKPVSMQRSRSSSAAAFDGAQMRMRGLAATFAKLHHTSFSLHVIPRLKH